MAEIRLKGGFVTTDRRLDRVPGLHPGNRAYAVSKREPRTLVSPRPRSRHWRVGTWLNQGEEGACTGFARAHDMASKPQPWRDVAEPTARELYLRARQLDEWPGEDYEGSSVLGAALAAVEFGYLQEYWWAFTLEEFILALGNRAPAVIGVNWYYDMQNPNDRGYITPTGSLDGGHSTLISGQKLIKGGDGPWGIDMDRSFVEFWNSWGKGWGLEGTAKMTMRNWDRLRKEDGEVCFSVGVRQQAA